MKYRVKYRSKRFNLPCVIMDTNRPQITEEVEKANKESRLFYFESEAKIETGEEVLGYFIKLFCWLQFVAAIGNVVIKFNCEGRVHRYIYVCILILDFIFCC